MRARTTISGLAVAAALALLPACGLSDAGTQAGFDAASGGDTSPGQDGGAGDKVNGTTGDVPPEAAADLPPPAPALALAFERVGGSGAFRALVTVLEGGAPRKGATVLVTSTRGSVGAVADRGDGTYEATVTPDATRTGEYEVTASTGTLSVRRTALVLDAVDDRWGQPEAVRGLVNTAAWEDSLAVTPDGEWLFLEYLPVPIDCLLLAKDPAAPVCAKARGPVTGPERPGMPGAERVAADGTIHHGCPSVGFDPATFPVPPSSLFGFHRQPDGSFAEPFAISVAGIDGCISAYGPSPFSRVGGKTQLLFAFDDPFDDKAPGGDTRGDLYLRELELGKPATLATIAAGKLSVDATRLGFPPAGGTGNPSQLVAGDGSVKAVFFDDETQPAADQDLFVRKLVGGFPGGPFADAAKLPPAISKPGVSEIQPFFDNAASPGELYFRRDNQILSSAWSGGALDSAAAWATPRTDLAVTGAWSKGAMVTVGEPNVAWRAGKRVLYFIYAVVAPDGTLDLNAGVVEGR